MKILSLFDGMSCGYIALQQAGIPITEYHTFENDKYAIQASRVVTGDINVIRHGEINLFTDFTQFKGFDLIMGGSPCQGFSFAGKQLNFSDPRSQLFFEFVRAIREAKPKYFLLENVKMKKEYLDVITKYLGVQPIFINSALVSAQNRQRYYWCNWKVEQPKDRGILLKDIIETGDVDRDKSHAIVGSIGRTTEREFFKKNQGQLVKVCNVNPSGNGMNGNVYDVEGKSPTLTTNKGEGIKITGGAIRGRYNENGKVQQQLELNHQEKANCITSVQKDSLLINANNRELKQMKNLDDKSKPLLASMWKGSQSNGMTNINLDNITWRKLTPRECFRLQTIPEDIIDKLLASGISNTQLYKMAGNGFTCEVIAHNLKELKLNFSKRK